MLSNCPRLIRLDSLYLGSELAYLADDIFVSSLYVFDISDVGISGGDKSRYDHSDSGSQVPTGDCCASESCWPKYECCIRIHDGWMSFHLLNLNEPVESALVDDFLESANPFSLRQ